jgi:hypothetical protein
MRRLLRWYGASPLHLLALLGGFALAGYAAARLVPSRPLGIATWFLGAVIGHDLLLMPLYTLADRSAAAVIRHRAPRLPALPWINYLRVPAALSGLLLLVWFPLILRLRTRYQASTTLSPDPYLWHWLAVTGVLFLASAVALALRIRSLRQPPAPPEPEPEPAPPSLPPPGTGPDDPGHGPDALPDPGSERATDIAAADHPDHPDDPAASPVAGEPEPHAAGPATRPSQWPPGYGPGAPGRSKDNCGKS